MNYAIVYLFGILFFSLLYWFVRGRKYYTGPLIEADIDEQDSQNNRSSDEVVDEKTEKHGNIIQ